MINLDEWYSPLPAWMKKINEEAADFYRTVEKGTPAKPSIYRTASSRAKISMGIFILPLLAEKDVAVCKIPIDQSLYIEIHSLNLAILAYRDKCSYCLVGDGAKKKLDGLDIFAGCVGYTLWDMFYGENKETKEVIDELSDYEFDFYGNKALVFLFCDSEYQYRRQLDRGEEATESLKLMALNIAARNGAIQKCEAPYLAEPKFIKIAPKGEADEVRETDDVLDKCRKGSMRISYEWSEEQKGYIPPLSMLDNFVEIEQFEPLVRKLKYRLDKALKGGCDTCFVNFSLVGKPGTGKTRLVHALGAALGLPVYPIPCSQNTDEDEFQGMTKFVNGKPTPVETDCVKAFKNGGILLLEEVNLTQPAVVMGALGQAVEFPYILKEDGYKTVHRHPLCVIVSTMNVGTAGSKTVSQPFANRFKQSYVLDDPDPSTFVNILLMADHDTDRARAQRRCTWLYKVYTSIVNAVKNDNATADVDSILMTLSMRSCFGALENMEEGNDPIQAVRDSIIGKIAETDLEVADNCRMVLETISGRNDF